MGRKHDTIERGAETIPQARAIMAAMHVLGGQDVRALLYGTWEDASDANARWTCNGQRVRYMGNRLARAPGVNGEMEIRPSRGGDDSTPGWLVVACEL